MIMGFHKTSATRNMRQPQAHLDRKENGDVYGVLKLGFKKNAKEYSFCFIGESANTLTFDGEVIEKHPKFKNITQFESWCRKYTAEHDLE